jgi:hypothetical protein
MDQCSHTIRSEVTCKIDVITNVVSRLSWLVDFRPSMPIRAHCPSWMSRLRHSMGFSHNLPLCSFQVDSSG